MPGIAGDEFRDRHFCKTLRQIGPILKPPKTFFYSLWGPKSYFCNTLHDFGPLFLIIFERIDQGICSKLFFLPRLRFLQYSPCFLAYFCRQSFIATSAHFGKSSATFQKGSPGASGRPPGPDPQPGHPRGSPGHPGRIPGGALGGSRAPPGLAPTELFESAPTRGGLSIHRNSRSTTLLRRD